MIVRPSLDPRIIWKVARVRLLTLTVLSTGVYSVHRTWFPELALSALPASILGVAISFLIGFRVNNAYERWWEARKVWGAIVNDSRSFARQALTFVTPHWNKGSEPVEGTVKQLVYAQIGFAHALRASLRRQDVSSELAPFFAAEELAQLTARRSVPTAILQLQAERLRRAFERAHTEDFRHMQMDATLNRLCDAMGACERIKNTVFPRQYSVYSSQFTRCYCYLLPFILVGDSGVLVVPFTLLIGFIFFALDSIANGIENPFENTYNDTPMSAISRGIEIDLRQMLGERDAPPPIEPVNGFLY
jgi:putative membrane protein